MAQVTLLFPSFQNFRLWCRDFDISYGRNGDQALIRNDQPLGSFRPAEDDEGGILAEVIIQPKGGQQHENATVQHP
jgi:hypothetical protein